MSWQPSSRREKDNHKVGGVSAVLDAADEAWSPTVTVLSDTTQRYAHATGLLSMYNLGPQLSIAAARVALLVRRVVREADNFSSAVSDLRVISHLRALGKITFTVRAGVARATVPRLEPGPARALARS